MLILCRNKTQKLIINGNIAVTILAIKGNQVKLGIEAPSEVTVDREEIHLKRLASPQKV